MYKLCLWHNKFFLSFLRVFTRIEYYFCNRKRKTFINKQNNRIMDKYVCNPCGWVYDPAIGDPENGIDAGTSFENLPDDWACPLCGAGKEEFEKI